MALIRKTMAILEMALALLCLAGIARVVWLLRLDNPKDEWSGLSLVMLMPMFFVFAIAGYSLWRYGKYKLQLLPIVAITAIAVFGYCADRGCHFLRPNCSNTQAHDLRNVSIA